MTKELFMSTILQSVEMLCGELDEHIEDVPATIAKLQKWLAEHSPKAVEA